jgi:hypothetical protein
MPFAAPSVIGRFGVPGALSVLIHAVVVAQRLAPGAPEGVDSPPIQVSLRSAETAPRPVAEAPAPPPPVAPPRRPHRRSAPQRPTSTPPTEPTVPRSPARPPTHDHPPRGAFQGAKATAPSAIRGRHSTVPSPATPPSAREPVVEPLNLPEGAGANAGAAPAGAGFSFDFWSPPDFNREIARAERAIGEAERAHQREKTTDLGHGVICNTDGHWFLCGHDDIDACNAAHDRMCRYAKPAERWLLTEEVILFQ